ncbi:TolC family protein [Crateriforma conspicua]|uniref:TolC family protein n=1 Tax=Crateriforma conspicua TaxID=2527996 RepID=UPI00118B8AB7|nr:TolC family protein [Crateriforma conspicua]QDV65615.1 Outer membrane efflux protein [Crateriforma conspicua]
MTVLIISFTNLRSRWFVLGTMLGAVCLSVGGCTRKHYRTQADCDVEAIYQEKRAEEAWNLPRLPGIQVDPRSRFFDPSPEDCPALPPPEPRLHGYTLPQLATGDPRQSVDLAADESGDLESVDDSAEPDETRGEANPETTPQPELIPAGNSPELIDPGLIDPNVQGAADQSQTGTHQPIIVPPYSEFKSVAPSSSDPTSSGKPKQVAAATASVGNMRVADTFVQQTSAVQLAAPGATDGSRPAAELAISDDADPEQVDAPEELALPADSEAVDSDSLGQLLQNAPDADADNTPSIESDAADDERLEDSDAQPTGGLRIVPIPPEYWGRIPQTCIPRMLEFESVREEFRRSYPKATDAEIEPMLSDAPRLSLPNVMELTLINSREYQTRKEILYRVALRLTRERYDFWLRPTRRGNGTALNYTHSRFRGLTNNRLAIPTNAAVTQTLCTGGQFLASFANSVVLTFNGPQGFAADVGSELLFDFQQSLLQRDIVFESLTQAERDVIYAARDLIRYRRELFVDMAGRYYNLLLTYRAIEISSQDYFSNLRAFLQGRAEYLKAGRIPRIQVDQFEQNALRSQSSLVGDCNRLETSLDRLKLAIGLPPEMPLNISLSELEALTTSDELTVTRQLVQRTKTSLLETTAGRWSERDSVVNGATVLVDRLMDTLRVRNEVSGIDEVTDEQRAATQLESILALIESRLQADQLDAIRRRELSGDLPPEPMIRFARTVDLIDAKLAQAEAAIGLRALMRQAESAASSPPDPDAGPADPVEDNGLEQLDQQVETYNRELDQWIRQWETAIEKRQLDELESLSKRGDPLLQRVDRLDREAAGDLLPDQEGEMDELIAKTVKEIVDLVDQVAGSDVGGLDEVDIDDDEAMLTALVQRYDLMNQRGELADARRQIKLAADDLRSIIDIRATHILRTRSDVNRAFDFTFDDSETRLSFALDTPLNRRIERNAYRTALINYNAARRALIDQEDQIKFSIRERLRQLRLRRTQYEIAVASAALAYERVVSTRLQLQLAVGNVVARDFLEAQQDFTGALNSVAREHINFILERIDLFLAMEAIRLDPNGYWEGVDDEQLELPLRPPFLEANPNPYGRLAPCLMYSDEIRSLH